jgi:SAM-dependent methyltransferase
MLSNLDWIGVDFVDPSVGFEDAAARQVRVLDYACGPGTMTSALWGRASEFVGVDVSANMVMTYNERFAEGRGSERSSRGVTDSARAVVGDLLSGDGGPSSSVSGAEFFGFDLAVVGYGFHHFEDVGLATGRLVERLKPGGVLLIVDLASHELEGENPARPIIAHHGFGAEEVRELFRGAGLVEVGVLEMEGMIEMKKSGAGDEEPGHKRKVFLGRGRKPV